MRILWDKEIIFFIYLFFTYFLFFCICFSFTYFSLSCLFFIYLSLTFMFVFHLFISYFCVYFSFIYFSFLYLFCFSLQVSTLSLFFYEFILTQLDFSKWELSDHHEWSNDFYKSHIRNRVWQLRYFNVSINYKSFKCMILCCNKYWY